MSPGLSIAATALGDALAGGSLRILAAWAIEGEAALSIVDSLEVCVVHAKSLAFPA